MAYDYADEISLSKELIDEFGRTVSIKRKSSTLIDAAKPWLGTEETYTSYSCSAVVYPIDERHVNNTSVLSGDMLAYVAASGLAIEPGIYDLFVDGSDTYNVVSASVVRTGSPNILYTLTLRK